MVPERRNCVRHKVQGKVFASFDGVTGGFILDLSEQGMAMQSDVLLDPHRRVQLQMNLSDSDCVQTTAYVAWADALGRAGVRFSELPEEARVRLNHWLASHASAPSRKAPKYRLGESQLGAHHRGSSGDLVQQPWIISLEPEVRTSAVNRDTRGQTVEYEFRQLDSDLPGTLRLIGERARSLTRGTGAVIALGRDGSYLCRASVGANAPALGARFDATAGFSGECVRTGKALRCDDTEKDARVDLTSCRRLGIRSIVAAPVQYEREIIGILEVVSARANAFEENDLMIVERLAQTVLLTVTHLNAV